VNKMQNNHLKGSLSRCLFIFIAMWLTSTVEASHFRFGHFTWEARPDISPETADFRMTVAFRGSAFGRPNIGQTFQPGSFNFGDGRVVRYNFEVIARNLQEDWIVGRAIESGQENGIVRHQYPSVNNNGAPWSANFSSCCKIGALRNARSASWRVITQVNLEGGNASPFSNLPPIVTCSKFDCRFRIPAVDPNGDRLTWRMATRSESAIPSIPSGMEVDTDTGIFTWTGSDTFTNGLYSVQVVIEDRDDDDSIKSNTAIDFIINLQDQGANAWPEFDMPPTPESGSVIRAIVGQALNITVQATDPDPNDEVFLNHVGLPLGAVFEQTVSGSVTGVASLQWTPSSDDMGQHIVTFLANDNRGGASIPVAITIDVIKPAISDVRVVSTISTADIQINANSYSLSPSSVTVDAEHTLVTWEFPTFNVGQVENLNTQLQLFDLQPGEQRVVTEKLELFYIDIDGQPVYELLGEQRVKVAPTLTRVSVDTDKDIYQPGEIVTITSLLENLSDIPTGATVELEVVDSQQSLVIALGTFSENAIPAQGQVALPSSEFDTAGIYAGAYEAVAKLIENGEVLQQAMAPFAIVTENGDFVNVGALVNTDKPLYQAWDQTVIGLRALNLAKNAAFNRGQGLLRVLRPDGELLVEQSYAFNSLAPEAIHDRQYVLPLVDREEGSYQVQWTITQDNVVVATSNAVFDVERSELASLVGAVNVSRYPTGEAQSCVFETTNRSAISPTIATLIYQVVSLDTGELVFEVRETDVAVVNTSGHPYQLLLSDPPAYGGYGCILMAEIEGELQELAAVGYEVTPPTVNGELNLANKGRLLVLVDDLSSSAEGDSNSAAEQRTYLENLLQDNYWRYTLVDNADDFTAEFHSGLYSAVALLSENVAVSPEVEQLLVEAQGNGMGVLVSGSWGRRNNRIEKFLGIKIEAENNLANTIIDKGVVNLPVADSALVSQALALVHCGAQAWAIFNAGENSNDSCVTSDTPTAVSVAEYRRGRHAYFAFDILDAATSVQSLHEQLFLKALSHIQPDVWPVAADRVIPIELSLENFSHKASVDVLLTLPQGGEIIDSQLPIVRVDNAWLWQYDFSSPSEVPNVFYIQLPEGVADEITLVADINAGINRSLMVDNSELAISLGTIKAENKDPIYVRDNVLYIRGTDGKDSIQVSDDGRRWKIQADFNDGATKEEVWVDKSKIDLINVKACGGDDQVQMGSLTIPSIVYGDQGDDQLQGGDFEDTMFGGAGDDQLQGNKGNDALYGGSGKDDVKGGDGKDIEKKNSSDSSYGSCSFVTGFFILGEGH